MSDTNQYVDNNEMKMDKQDPLNFEKCAEWGKKEVIGQKQYLGDLKDFEKVKKLERWEENKWRIMC